MYFIWHMVLQGLLQEWFYLLHVGNVMYFTSETPLYRRYLFLFRGRQWENNVIVTDSIIEQPAYHFPVAERRTALWPSAVSKQQAHYFIPY
jgi:hypothetical protein